MSSDYLWDRSGEADGELRALERALGRRRFRGELPPLPERAPAHRRRRRLAVGLAAAAAAVVALPHLIPGGPTPRGGAYAFEAIAGAPRVGGRAATSGSLRPGERIVCGADARARVRVGSIGEVVLEEHGRLRVEPPAETGPGVDAEYLLYLERGRMSASIFAAPRLFQVGTPAGMAVDLGCVYSAEVLADGRTRLAVEAGVVSFETEARRIVVPAGAFAWADPASGPGTPVWERAPAAYAEAVAAVDRGELEALERVLDVEDEAASLTLWHLADPRSGKPSDVRERALAKLAAIAPPPAGVEPPAILAGDAAMHERWRATLSWDW